MISQQSALQLLNAHYSGSNPLNPTTVDQLNNIAYPTNSTVPPIPQAPQTPILPQQTTAADIARIATPPSNAHQPMQSDLGVMPNQSTKKPDVYAPLNASDSSNYTPGPNDSGTDATEPTDPTESTIVKPTLTDKVPESIAYPTEDKAKPAPITSGITAQSNPITDAEKKWYETNYGSPAVEAKPSFTPMQNSQLKVLDGKLNKFDETLAKIENDTSMSPQTKAALTTEVNSRRQAVQNNRQSIIDSATQNGSQGKAETKGIVGDIESGIKKETAMNVQEAEDTTNTQAETNKQLTANETSDSAARNLRMQKTAAYVDGLNKDAAALANYNEDPDRWWNSKSSYEQVGLSIAGALGAWAGTKSGHNMAAEQINKNIDRDIEAQRNSYNAKKSSFDAKKSLYAANLEQYKDPEAAIAASKVMLIDQSARKIQQLKDKNNSGRVQQAGDLALLQLQKNRADAEKAYAERMYALQHPAGAGSGGSVKQEVVDKVAGGFKVIESYGQAATDIANLASKGDVNLNPSGLRKAAAGAESLVTGDQESNNFKYGEAGNAIKKRVEQVVVENPVVGEHSDSDRENAINAIIGDGNPQGIVKRLQARGQTAAREVQRETQGLSPKDQTTLSNRVTPPQITQPLPPPAPRQR